MTNVKGVGMGHLQFKIRFALLGAALLALIHIGCSKSSGIDGGPENGPANKSFDGTSNGGGGKGVLCGRNLQVLDLFEAQLGGKALLPAGSDYVDNLERFGVSLVGYLATPGERPVTAGEVVAQVKKDFEPKVVYLPPGQTLAFTNDATLPSIPENCKFVQIAVWSSDGHIYIDSDLWNQLDAQNRAALALHEILYKVARDRDAKTSDEARAILAEVFTTPKPEPRFGPVLSSPEHVWCGAGGGEDQGPIFEVYAIDEIQSGTRGIGFYFHAIAGEHMLSRTVAFMPGRNIRDLLDPHFSSLMTNVVNARRKLKWRYEFKEDITQKNPAIRMMSAWTADQPRPSFSHGFCKLE